MTLSLILPSNPGPALRKDKTGIMPDQRLNILFIIRERKFRGSAVKSLIFTELVWAELF